MDRRAFLTGIAAAGVASRMRAAQTARWRAGAAAVDITPDRSLWMAGFARRTQASQGTALPLHAKALALQAGTGTPVVLVTVDLLGLTARISDGVAATVRRRHRLSRASLLFNASHTHCGPVVDRQLSVAYDLSPAQWQAIDEYMRRLEADLVTVIDRALAALEPASVTCGRDTATFAANRRVAFSPKGPVDHSVPVLHVSAASGSSLAIVFGYACHNTTLGDAFVQYHGDYAGVAQAALQRRHPGAIALFVAGCGADANPMPRGTLELVEQHGTALADAVDRALGSTAPVPPRLRVGFNTVDLRFADEATRTAWRGRLTIEEVYLQRHAALMQQAVARDGRLPSAQADPVQVWQLGPPDRNGLTFVALGGEVVVDYALRLTRELSERRLWVAGYSNDVFGYVPSERVLREGGYEGGDAMIYYARPGPFAPGVEETIVAEVRRLAQQVR